MAVMCQELVEKGVLINPYEYSIQPIIVNNSWVTRKPAANPKPFDQCTVKDISLVIGFDPNNKFLQDPPGKVTKKKLFMLN